MPDNFDLIITADTPSLTADLCLQDGHGNQLAYRQTDFHTITVSLQKGLFDLRNYLRSYVEPGQEAAALADIGVCIAEQVLGSDIFNPLWLSQSPRTLRIQLPGATDTDNLLAAALARVPWEMGRPTLDQVTLADRNLLVRVVHTLAAPATQPLTLAAGEPLRVLFVFAEARGARPLAARQERRDLLDLFRREIYPQRRIVAHVLAHGVTRQRLEAQIQEHGGYHMIHWSGHGHLNRLELAQPGGTPDEITGQELLNLFVEAGGFIPHLVFLSTCYSGDILRVKDWDEFSAIVQGQDPRAKTLDSPAAAPAAPLDASRGYTGTAHALLQGGVPTVVAMRYAVGDEYSRDLGLAFYRALLAQAQPKPPATALTLARRQIQTSLNQNRYNPWDTATPVLYGAEQPLFTLPSGRSPSLESRNPRLHRIAELTLAAHPYFVGRTWELDALGADFIGASRSPDIKPVALIIGLGGMGKTALVAEALDLWQARFEWVLLYQAKPNPLSLDATLRDIDLKFRAELGRYHDYIQEHPADAIYRDPSDSFTGPERQDRLVQNLIRAMQDEALLLVLDNFETNLKPQAEPGSEASPLWACQDPAWDRALHRLATELVDTPSRVLITSRHPLAALANTSACSIDLGPLTSGEAALYIRSHSGLSQMYLGPDPAAKALAQRLLQTSRFHPLLMDRLAKLAIGGPALRPQLVQALETLEHSQDYSQLPTLFTAQQGDTKELTYLSDALTTSLDQLIQGASPEARRLLWLIALANQPEALGLVSSVWSGEETPKTEQLRQVQQLLDQLHQLPPELQAKLQAMPSEIRALIDALPAKLPLQPDFAPLLRALVAVGLVTEERTDPADTNPNLTCHALVRERVCIWMAAHPQEQNPFTENALRLAYAAWLEATFKDLQHQDMTAALEAGSRAMLYIIQAQAYDRLGSWAGAVITSIQDPQHLAQLLPPLQAAAEAAPAGRPRWRCLCYVADALQQSNRPDDSLPFYEQAACLASTVGEDGGITAPQAYDLGWITGNWAVALLRAGYIDAACQRQRDSAEAKRLAGLPEVNVLSSELEALRMEILQNQAAAVLPQAKAHLAQVETWWQQHRQGQPVPEARDFELLSRVLITALDIVRMACDRQREWDMALSYVDRSLEVEQSLQRPAEAIAETRFNRAGVLACLARYGEAHAELEVCLELFQENPYRKAMTLSALASLLDDQGDGDQAVIQERRALVLFEQLPNPRDSARSHNNLANYLKRRNHPADLAEAARHRLTALTYHLVIGLAEDLQTSLYDYTIDFRRAQAAGTTLELPCLAELLADPAFAPLATWLDQRQVVLDDLQAALDQFLEQARQAALDSP